MRVFFLRYLRLAPDLNVRVDELALYVDLVLGRLNIPSLGKSNATQGTQVQVESQQEGSYERDQAKMQGNASYLAVPSLLSSSSSSSQSGRDHSPVSGSRRLGTVIGEARVERTDHLTFSNTQSQAVTSYVTTSPLTTSVVPNTTGPSSSSSSSSDQITPKTSGAMEKNSTHNKKSISREIVYSRAPNPAPSTSGLRDILVVDDDYLTRAMMVRLLNRLGYNVQTAENGKVAMEMILSGMAPGLSDGYGYGDGGDDDDGNLLARPNSPQSILSEPERNHRYLAVFMDNQMPTMSGLEAVAHLRRLGRRDFVVGVTGNALLTDQEEYLGAGVD